jgi:hypothetical protein
VGQLHFNYRHPTHRSAELLPHRATPQPYRKPDDLPAFLRALLGALQAK